VAHQSQSQLVQVAAVQVAQRLAVQSDQTLSFHQSHQQAVAEAVDAAVHLLERMVVQAVAKDAPIPAQD
jgi:hypothetical protein